MSPPKENEGACRKTADVVGHRDEDSQFLEQEGLHDRTLNVLRLFYHTQVGTSISEAELKSLLAEARRVDSSERIDIDRYIAKVATERN